MNTPDHSRSDNFSSLVAVDRRLNLSFGVLILALMLIVLTAATLYLDGVMKREEQQLSTLLTRILAVSVSRVSFSGRYHAQLLLEDIQADHPNIRYLLITDREGRVLAGSDPDLIDSHLQGEAEALAREAMAGEGPAPSRRRRIDGEPVLEVTLPYRGDYDHSVQGVVQVGLSQASRAAALRQGFYYVTGMVAALLVLGIFIVHRISRAFGMPIRDLAGDMAATLQALPDLLFELDGEGRYVQVLAHRQELLVDDPAQLLGRTIHEMLPPGVAGVVTEAMREAADKGTASARQYSLVLPDGPRWFELSVARKPMGRNAAPNFIVLSRDITERKRAEENLYLFANAFEHSGEAILITDQDNRIVTVNPALEKDTGFSRAELEGRNPRVLASGYVSRDTYREMWRGLRKSGYWQGELSDRGKGGDVLPKWASISAIRNDAGEVTHYIASYTDISERKAAEERIEFIAHHDVLTGLFNRYSLEERLEQALLGAQRRGDRLAVMFIDMDRFKNINDTLGHHTGDQLLVEIGRRLQHEVRRSDIVARLGGDEFILVLGDAVSEVTAGSMAGNLIRRLGEPYRLQEQELHITASIGISLFPDDGSDAETLMKHADAAMYSAKDKGRNNFQFFTPEMNRAIEERMSLENDMRLALQHGQFELHFQPVCDHRGEWLWLEALARWRHPEKGHVPPNVFIPIAEESRLILPLGDWVIEQACRHSADWRDRFGFALPIAVNLSVHQLYAVGLIDRVGQLLQQYRIAPGGVKFEITETAAMENPEQAIEVLHRLRAAGIELAIDDFGTGYSSLAYLKRLPIQTLKLDRTFVRDIDQDENDAAISAATVALAHNLGLGVVAEGVETQQQLQFLVEHGCDYIQGFLFSRPLAADAVDAHLLSARTTQRGA